jgi:hypothetical protein
VVASSSPGHHHSRAPVGGGDDEASALDDSTCLPDGTLRFGCVGELCNTLDCPLYVTMVCLCV